MEWAVTRMTNQLFGLSVQLMGLLNGDTECSINQVNSYRNFLVTNNFYSADFIYLAGRTHLLTFVINAILTLSLVYHFWELGIIRARLFASIFRCRITLLHSVDVFTDVNPTPP